MKKYLWIVLFFITNLGFAQPSVDLTKSNTNNNLMIQLVDSKLANVNNKLTAVEQSNKDDIADLKARMDEKLADKFKQLDDKGADVGWWLAFIGIIMAIATFVVAAIQIVSTFGLMSLRKEADRLLKQIRDNHKESVELTKKQKEMLENPPTEVTEQNKQDIEKINDILLEKPENQLTAKNWFIRGINAQEQKEYYEAITYYNHVIKLNPTNKLAEYAYNNRGNAKSKLKQYEEAIKDFNRAIELDPNDEMYCFNKACAYALMKNKTEALNWLEKALQLDYSVEKVLKDEDWKNYLNDNDFKNLIAKYTKR